MGHLLLQREGHSLLHIETRTGRNPARSPQAFFSRFRFKRLLRLCPPPLLLALLVFGLAWLIGLLRGPLLITMGDDERLDLLYLETGQGGFYQPESRLASGGSEPGRQSKTTYRWAGKTSYINLPWPTEAVPLKATLHLSAPRPNRAPDQGGTNFKVSGLLEWDKLDLGQFDLSGLYEGSDYIFKVPVHLRPNLARLALKFEASDLYPFEASRDPRALSVIFFSLKLEPDYAEFGWRGWLATLARPGLLAIITLACWGLASLALQKNRLALLLEAGVGLTLLLSMLFWSLAAEPFYAPWAFILPLGWLLVGLAGLFCRRAARLPAPFVFTATIFPIVPLAQFAFGRLDLYSVNPSSVIIGLYSGALLYSAAFYFYSNNNVAASTNPFEQAFERAILFASLASYVYTHFSIWQLDFYKGSDFKFYYQLIQSGSAAYARQAMAEPVPPTMAILLEPLTALLGNEVGLALIIWRVFNEVLLLLVLLGLVKIFGGVRQGQNYTPAIIFLVLNFGQVAETIGYGQYNIMVLLALVILIWSIKQPHPTLSGVSLALAFSLKPYLILLAPFLVFVYRSKKLTENPFALATNDNSGKGSQKYSQFLGGFGAALVLITLILWLTNWLAVLPNYFFRLAAQFAEPPPGVANQGWWAFLIRLTLPQSIPDDLPRWLALIGYAGILGAVTLTFYTLRHSRSFQNFELTQLKAGSLIFLSLLIAPLVEMPASTAALVGLVALLISFSQGAKEISAGQLLLFALAYAILAYGSRYDFFDDTVVGLARPGSSYRFLALAGLWLLALWQLRKQPI